MELVIRLPRGRRERFTSQITKPSATASSPLPRMTSFWKPVSAAAPVSVIGVITAVTFVRPGGLVAATITGGTKTGAGADVTGAGGGMATGVGLAGGATTTGVATILGGLAGRLAAVVLVTVCAVGCTDGGSAGLVSAERLVPTLVPTMMSAGTGTTAGAVTGGDLLTGGGSGLGAGGGGNFGKLSGTDRFTEQPRYSP